MQGWWVFFLGLLRVTPSPPESVDTMANVVAQRLLTQQLTPSSGSKGLRGNLALDF